MKTLTLAKLPDRNPVKRTIVFEPELNRALEKYALLYREAYGEAESVETLVPFMLAAFLAKDRAFAAFRKAQSINQDVPGELLRKRSRRYSRVISEPRSNGDS